MAGHSRIRADRRRIMAAYIESVKEDARRCCSIDYIYSSKQYMSGKVWLKIDKRERGAREITKHRTVRSWGAGAMPEVDEGRKAAQVARWEHMRQYALAWKHRRKEAARDAKEKASGAGRTDSGAGDAGASKQHGAGWTDEQERTTGTGGQHAAGQHDQARQESVGQ